MLKIKRVYSGGQSGADVAGLKFAKLHHLETGGYCPKGFRDENGFNPTLKEYGLVETEARSYVVRTELNVVKSDFTIIFNPAKSVGSDLTERLCNKHNQPYLVVTDFDDMIQPVELFKLLESYSVETLNIAGNRESVSPGIENKVIQYLTDLIKVM